MTNASNGDLDLLLSRMQILDCITRIARGVDRLDVDLVRSGYHDDAEDDHATFVGGPQAFVDYFFPLHRQAHLSTQHIINNHSCEIEGEVAHAETYYVFASRNAEGPPMSLAGGRYIDRFERRNGRWAIAVRKCVLDWDLTPDSPVSIAMTEAFAAVGCVSRDRNDVSYVRPNVISAERLAAVSGCAP